MVIAFAVVMFGLLAICRPLQRNPFYILHSALVVLAAYYADGRFFTISNPFSPKILLVLLVFHIISINIIAFIAMWVDKRAAQKRGNRISEKNMHQLELMGGVPGSWLGQRVFNHKTSKRRYQNTFMGILIIQIFIVIGVCKYLGFF